MSKGDTLAEYGANVIHAADKFGGSLPPGPPLQPPGGGGTSDGMEARVARLEADVGHIKDDVADLKASMRTMAADVSTARVDIGVLKEKVNNLPTKAYIGAFVSGGVVFMIAALTLLSRLGFLVAGAAK